MCVFPCKNAGFSLLGSGSNVDLLHQNGGALCAYTRCMGIPWILLPSTVSLFIMIIGTVK